MSSDFWHLRKPVFVTGATIVVDGGYTSSDPIMLNEARHVQASKASSGEQP